MRPNHCLLFVLSIWHTAHGSILTGDDLKRGSIVSPGSPVKEDRTLTSSWVCIPTKLKSLKIKCDDLGFNKLEGQKAELQIAFTFEKIRHEYGLRHGILTTECMRIFRAMKRDIAKSESICFRGDGFIPPNSKNALGWVFDEYKANSGGGCEFIGCD